MKKMLMLATTAAMIEQFNKNNILILENMGYEVHVAGNFLEGNPISDEKLKEFKGWITEHHGKWYHIPSTRKPTDIKNNIKAYQFVEKLINKNNYEFIHCHTPIGSVMGRISAHKTHTKIIYTAHGFHFFKGAPLKNWMLYYPIERFLSRWTDILILINQEDYQRAKKKFHAKKIRYIPGIGIDIDKFRKELIDRPKKRQEIGLTDSDIMLLSIGELIPRKNHEIVIRAIQQLNNPQIKYLICGKGELLTRYKKMSTELGIEEQVCFLGYREDISELCQAADIYIHPSLQEGLSIALMEAMACKIPVICSDIRGNIDLIKDKKYIFNPLSVEDIVEHIKMVIQNDNTECIIKNYEKLKRYNLSNINEMMKKEYIFISNKEA